MSDNIKVVVKVRPLIPRELDQKLSFQWRVKNNTLYQLDESANEFGPSFTFDKIYDETTKTHEVYNDVVKPIVESAIGGINGTIFAYGQTSSGKTYTMTGTDESPGIIPLSVKHLFEVIKTTTDRDFLVRVSYIEIYNETVRDLLSDERKNIKIYETGDGVKFDATEKPTSSPEEVLAVMKEGEVNRQTGATNMNEESSRSHSIFQITIESRKHVEGEEETGCVNVSQLNLVDLAGSERAGQTGATGIRFKEGTHINKSLSVLALVIKQLSENPNQHANYRDSKLTRILQNSIGGNAKTSIICAITPASVEETISTLQFANRAKSIKNKPEVNAVAKNATKIHDLMKLLSKLKTQLESKKNLEQDNVNLQRQIAGLQKFILNGLSRPAVEVASSGRKKWQQSMRRVTISTLHPINEDPVPCVSNVCAPGLPSYCTPSLKYNPITLDQSQFVPIQNNSQLLSEPENSKEPPRLVTPPPKTQDVVDVINLDSDDESSQDSCSPYHKCKDKVKTPPCVLKKTAKEAEKNLKDIMELTEREKMYTPSVVELLEKLEQNANVISKLEEKVSELSTESQEKETRLKNLQKAIEKAETQVKAVTSENLKLEMKCSDYDTKLTDLEVMYETLTKKYKTREEELLSLLREQEEKLTKCDKNFSTTSNPVDQDLQFLEMSSISLVSSDENSSAESSDDVHKHIKSKNQSADQFKSKILAQKQKICILETSKKDLELKVQSLENKLAQIVNENDFLKSTVDNLKSNIDAQKETIRIANDDIKSYNSLIQELQIKLNEKHNIETDNIESNLEKMMMNEDKLAANNENMKNLIQTMRNALEDKVRKEKLKTDKEISYWKEQVEIKEKEIKSLIESVESLKTLDDENKIVINNLFSLKEELTNKLSETEEHNSLLRKQSDLSDHKVLIQELTSAKDEITKKYIETKRNSEEHTRELNILLEKNANLVNVLSEKERLEKELSEKVTSLETQNKDLLKKIGNLETEIVAKTNLLKSMSENHNEIKNKLLETILKKLNCVLQISTCETINIPENLDDYDSFIEILKNFLDRFEDTAMNLDSIKQESDLKILEKEQELSVLKEKYDSKFSSLKIEVETLSEERNVKLLEIESLKQKIEMIQRQLNEMSEELDIKIYEISELETKLEEVKQQNENLHKDLLSKDAVVSSLQEKITDLLSETKNLSHEINQKDIKVASLEEKIKEITTENTHLTQEVTEKVSSISVLENCVSELMTENQKLKEEIDKKELESNHASITNDTQNDTETLQDYDIKLNFLRIMVENKNAEVSKLRKNIYCLRANSKEQLLEAKNQLISELSEKLNCVEQLLKDEEDKVSSLTQELYATSEMVLNRDNLLNLILENAKNIFSVWISSGNTNENNDSELDKNKANITYDQIIQTLQEIAVNIKTECESKTGTNLNQAQEIIEELTRQNSELTEEYQNISEKNKELLHDIEVIKQINQNLHGSNNLLEQLKLELQQKVEEIEFMKIKTQNIKAEFDEFQRIVTQQIEVLRHENEKLKKAIFSVKENGHKSIENEFNQCTVPSDDNDQKKNSKVASPQTLFTICCNKVIEDIQTQEATLSPNKNSTSGQRQIELACACIELNMQLKEIKEERQNLLLNVSNLESLNLYLTQERDDLRNEVQILLELIEELHKKIVNHRTNLSTLTATTYAENKLLNSQLKVLQHHHTRCVRLCQRDIPAFKIQLLELMSILNSSDFLEKQNINYKRPSLPDVLVNETTISTVKNESILDGDLLMLDTNITLSMSEDTLVGNDQTCLDATQTYGEAACQSNEEAFDPSMLQSQIEVLMKDNQKLGKTVEELKQENSKLRTDIDFYLCKRTDTASDKSVEDNTLVVKLQKELELLTQNLEDVKKENADVEKKYSDLVLEMPSSEALAKKINGLENDLSCKIKEVCKLTKEVSEKNKTIKDLEKENGELSNQLMENISEVDDLKIQLELYLRQKNDNIEEIKKIKEELDLLKQEHELLLKNQKEIVTTQDYPKENIPLQINATPEKYSKLNRSLSDSENSFRYHKIVTLQHQLNQSKEDCKKITEEVATIKTELEMDLGQPMDLDESMGYVPNVKNERGSPNISDEYTTDKINCINFLAEKTETDRFSFDPNMKAVDLMQCLYTNLISKHNNAVENLFNKLNDFEKAKKELESHLQDISLKYSNLIKDTNNEKVVKIDTKILKNFKDYLLFINDKITCNSSTDLSNFFLIFKENFLNILDKEFDLNSSDTFDSLINYVVSKNKKDVESVINENMIMKKRLESLVTELDTTKNDLELMKCQMIEEDKKCNSLIKQKENINGIFLSLQHNVKITILNIFEKMKDQNIMTENELDESLPVEMNLNILFARLFNELQNRNCSHDDEELRSLKNELQKKENELKSQKSSHEDLNKNYSKTVEEHTKVLGMIDQLRGKILEKQSSIEYLRYDDYSEEDKDLCKKVNKLIKEVESIRSVNAMILKEKECYALELEKSSSIIKQNKEEMDKMTADILQLRDSMKDNINLIESMKVEAKSMLDENVKLKEKLDAKNQDCSRLENNIKTLEKAAEIQNNMIKRLQKQKEGYEKVKCEQDTKIEELTSKCSSLQTECDTLNTAIDMYKKQIEDLTTLKSSLEARISDLQQECEQKYRLSIEAITNNAQRRRKSIQDSNRMFSDFEVDFEAQENKIQEMFDSRDPPQDLFMEVDEYEADSNRSTPLRLSKGRESLTMKLDQSERDDENLSRPSSVQSIRKRRQSTYDQRRSGVGPTPPPDEIQCSENQKINILSGIDKRDSIASKENEEELHSRPSSVLETRRRRQSMHDLHRSVMARSLSPDDAKQKLKPVLANTNIKCNESSSSSSLGSVELINLRERLAQTEQELEELKEKYRELDEECETCAQYLQERDQQCAALRREKIALEKVIEKLREDKSSETKQSLISVAVNTDEDWAQLHTVVVDRMSFDAEVEKNKKLMKTVEELRYSKQELNNVIVKMQKAMEKQAAGKIYRELDSLKTELKSTKEELEELKERYKELDDECETCAELLREREEQCRKLKEAKAALEAKLEEYEEEEKVVAVSRRRRHRAHDARRVASAHSADAATETADDLLSHGVEREDNLSQSVHESLLREITSLKLAYENVCKEKIALEHMLASRQTPAVHPTMFVATGSAIVQGQQITDLMKENHRLNKLNAKLIKLCKKRGKSSAEDCSADKEAPTG